MEEKKERVGVAIGIISRGWVPLKWMMHVYNQMKETIPVGMFWKFITVERKSWAEARTEVVKKAKEQNFKWLFFCFRGDEKVETDLGSKKIKDIKIGDFG